MLRLLVAAFLTVLLLGCLGSIRGQKDEAGNIGDADISPASEPSDSQLLPEEDVLPADFLGNETLSEGDLDFTDEPDFDFISEEDVVEPA